MTALPNRMTVIAIRQPGGPEVLTPESRPVPQPAAGEILVKIAAAGVNRPDVMQRMGLYPPPQGATDIPGLEIAGEVVARGAGVTRWKDGDVVMALVIGGALPNIASRMKATRCRSRRIFPRLKRPPSPKPSSPFGTMYSSAAD